MSAVSETVRTTLEAERARLGDQLTEEQATEAAERRRLWDTQRRVGELQKAVDALDAALVALGE